ncbi:hypothetical protein [Leptospira bandrabouensis]|uniref:hypothetical protein n=1 Tax=Leptospira bandrabouensis TaxID=2484903 RepID=UPI001EE7C342|nr:hypothetical protein [Leptospira bandrabouensis]MCG6144124.1 hypothetical protein [Leptospira bandrabouensis]MCG6159785.1 hypothetical protein [Leptospira bandrabouensis]MCG6163718.1 hypothetical protein [Leptospira bandrabouensis]
MNVIRLYKEEFILDIYYDVDLGNTHVADHGVTDLELYEFFSLEKYLAIKRKDGSFEAVGMTSNRSLKVIFRNQKMTKKQKNFFVITAWEYKLSKDETDAIRSREDL